MRNAAIGVVLIALATAAVIVGVSEVTSHRNGEAPPPTDAFGYCRAAPGPNCVVDGDTFYLAGQKIGVAGIDAPQMHPSRCAEEARLGTSAAVRLHELLNRGSVTISGSGAPGSDGRLLRKVEVKGADVAAMMVEAGVARDLTLGPRDWCATPESP